jgi:hypothetical protein
MDKNLSWSIYHGSSIQSSFARMKSARSAFVACTHSIPFSAAASRAALASPCSDQNSNHSMLLRLVISLTDRLDSDGLAIQVNNK